MYVAHNDPFSDGSKKTIFKRFYQLLFRTAGLQHKLLILQVSGRAVMTGNDTF